MTQRKAGLGRGLGALLPTANTEPTQESSTEQRVLTLQISDIKPNPNQPRVDFDQTELEELAASIREVGLLQPVVVRQSASGAYELLVGERRLRASKLAGLQEIPVLLRTADDVQALEQALVENLQRSDLSALEEATAYEQLIDVFDFTQEQVARRMGKSRTYVSNTLRLRDLPPSVRDLLASGMLTAGHARAILAIKDPAMQEALAKRVVDEGLTVRQVEAFAREASTDKAPSKTSKPAGRKPRFPDLEESLSDRFSTDVQIEVGRGRGRILITFGSRDDLDRISAMLLRRDYRA